ncbi:hypothetical protein [Burkholderia multivorans]|uniref:hypothetical protein n=1 Tax=Burkholderia multivorans TaxID=87883 RepID=UPI0006A5D4CE|nr:hypothetical protein [Burkholderia multivorans]
MPSNEVLTARVADLLHLLSFATIHTPSEGDEPQIRRALHDIKALLADHPDQPEPRAEVTDDDKVCAARYRWLSRQAVATHSYDELDCRWEVDYVLRGESFDAAVDAARSATGR